MFVFSFIGGLVSPYGQDEQFYTYTHMDKEYVGVVKNNDLRYTVNDGQEFGSILQAQLMLAIGKNADSFEYKDVTYEVDVYKRQSLYTVSFKCSSLSGSEDGKGTAENRSRRGCPEPSAPVSYTHLIPWRAAERYTVAFWPIQTKTVLKLIL